MVSVPLRAWRRIDAMMSEARCWMFLRRRVTGRIKLRGNVRRIDVHPSFRCDGDLWLGVHSDEGAIVIELGVTASGPLVITAIRPLRIGAGTLFGPNVLVTDHYHGDRHQATHRAMSPSARPLYSPGEIAIGRNVQLGANSVVLSPTTIGAGAVVAANAVVKGNVPELSVYVGLALGQNRDSPELMSNVGE